MLFTKAVTIFLVLAGAVLPPRLVNGRLTSKWCFRYREVFIDMRCDGQKPGRNFFCSLLEVMFRQDNVGNPPCLFYPCTGWGQNYPRRCIARTGCPADHIQALGMCSGSGNVCCRTGDR